MRNLNQHSLRRLLGAGVAGLAVLGCSGVSDPHNPPGGPADGSTVGVTCAMDQAATTPRAIASSLAAFAVGGELQRADQRLFTNLLSRNTTGDALIRSALPASWRVGDKTGSASYGARNDIAVVTPPGRGPIVLAVLTRHDTPDASTNDGLVAGAARAFVESWCERP